MRSAGDERTIRGRARGRGRPRPTRSRDSTIASDDTVSQTAEGLDIGNGPGGEDERENWLAELRAERHRLESVVLMMPAPVALHLGPEHRYVLANDAYQRVSGAHRQLIGRTPRELF